MPDITNLPPQLLRVHRLDILSPDRDAASGGAVEAQQQTRNGGLPGARGGDNGDVAAGRDGEGEVGENSHSGAGGICEGDVVKFDGAACRGDHIAFGGRDVRHAVLEFEEARGGSHAFHQLAIKCAQAEEAAARVASIHEEASQFAEGERAGAYHAASRIEEGEEGHVAHEA